MAQWITGKFRFRAGESAGIASTQDQRRWDRDSDTEVMEARAEERLAMTACGSLIFSAQISPINGVRVAFRSVAVGFTAEASGKCSANVEGGPAISGGRARPEGCI